MAERFSIYAGAPMLRALDAIGDDYAENRSGRLNAVCERYMAMVADELSRLDLSHDEWCAILEANNSAPTYPGHAEVPAMIWANLHDSPELGEKWKIDQRALVAKLQHLPRTALIAVAEVADRFWSRAEMPTDEALQAAGVQFSA